MYVSFMPVILPFHHTAVPVFVLCCSLYIVVTAVAFFVSYVSKYLALDHDFQVSIIGVFHFFFFPFYLYVICFN
jgi:hypothetical protein